MSDLQPMGSSMLSPIDASALSGSGSDSYDSKAQSHNDKSSNSNQGQQAMEMIEENPELLML